MRGTARHLRILAWLMLIGGLLTLPVFASALADLSQRLIYESRPGPETSVESLILLSSLVQIVAGAGMLLKQRWGSWFAIPVCALWMLSFPFGTFFGFYGLWIVSQSLEKGTR